jgi:N-acetylglucosaminyldiphosphoundecaprenol N-acetyl-beta-D-mannosaminyltransferase
MSESDSYAALGIRVDAVEIPDVLAQMDRWILERTRCHSIALAGMFGITEAQRDAGLKHVFNSADLVVPDGMPLIWIGRLRGRSLARRVYGPELMLESCENGRTKGYRHFFLGGAPGVPERLSAALQARFPGLQVAGVFSPPYRSVSPEEDEEIVAAINAAACDILWVGLGSPKQDRWMYEHRERLNVPVVVAVGAAFDMNSGTIKQAPVWMREHGFEWLYRLLQDPRRLWRRYLVNGAKFLVYVALEFTGLKRFNDSEHPRLPGPPCAPSD